MFKKILLTLSLCAIIGGCSIDKAHFKYDEQAFQLVGPLAKKELSDTIKEAEVKKQAGEITDDEFDKIKDDVKMKMLGIDTWGRVVEDNLK